MGARKNRSYLWGLSVITGGIPAQGDVFLVCEFSLSSPDETLRTIREASVTGVIIWYVPTQALKNVSPMYRKHIFDVDVEVL